MGSVHTDELLVILFLIMLFGLLFVFPAQRIAYRAGYSRWWGLLVLVPLGFLLWFWYLAFAKWPSSRVPESKISLE